MKTFIITAALSVLSLGHIAVAQDGKSLRTQNQIVELLASLPTQDTYTPTAPVFFTQRSAPDFSTPNNGYSRRNQNQH